MGLFGRKPKVRLDEFCRNFYDKHHLPATVAGLDLPMTYAEVIRQSITEVDPSFAAIGAELLAAEITPLRFEVFGLAWLHRQGDKRAAEQSDFTRRYLDAADRSDIWEAIQPYNQATARSSTLGRTGDTAAGRAYLTFVNTMRADLFDAWLALGFDAGAVARAANRIATDEAWKTGLTPGFLMCAVCDRVGCEPNEAAQFRLVAVIRGFYDGVAESLKSVAIHE